MRANYCTTSFGVGTITSDGGSAILERGFVFGTSSGPDLSNADVRTPELVQAMNLKV